MHWWGWAVVAGVTLALLAPLIFLYLRRRWLTMLGGLFECAYRLRDDVPGGGWLLGMGRCRGETLEWFRAFSLSLRPARTFTRGVTRLVYQRETSGVDAVVLYDETRILTLRNRLTSREDSIATDMDSALAIMAWFEAAPPGSHYLPSSADTPS
ncbi:MAG: DUF2550 domain-containing protein [Arachnia sp.]